MPTRLKQQTQLWLKRTPDPRSVLSALLIVLAFPPWDLSFLIWFALVPWFASLARAKSHKDAMLAGFWLNFFMSLGGFYWVGYVLMEFGGVSIWFGIAGLLVFCLFNQAQFMAFAAFWRWYTLRHAKVPALLKMLTLVAAYTAIDWLIPKLFRDTLGHSLYASGWLRQAADVGGAHLLTLVIVAVNYGLWKLAESLLVSRTSKRKSLRPLIPELATAFGLFAALLTYGILRDAQVREAIRQPIRTLRTAVIQGNIGDFDKVASERGVKGAAHKVLDTYLSMTDEALHSETEPDFIMWPETSYPSTFRSPQVPDEQARDQTLENYVNERGVPLIFGGYDHMNRKDYNALFILTPKALLSHPHAYDVSIYRKAILLLFGEYIPGAEHIQYIRDAFPQVGNFGRGTGPEIHELRTRRGVIKTNPIICYEALFPSFVAEGARRGSELILNVTNDSWFGPNGEPELHLALTAFRDIETRLPQVRATNTGISALILPDGSITQASKIGEAQIIPMEVPLIQPIPTLMKSWGDWFGPFVVLLAVVLTLLQARRGLARWAAS